MAKIYHFPKKAVERKLSLNTIYCADNLEVMLQLPSESIDLIYIDPPFCTQTVRKDKAWDQNVQTGQFDDKWGGGIKSYMVWMNPRLRAIHRLLKPTGSLFVHVDRRAVHYIKMELDKIFGNEDADRGMRHFKNEIIWHYSGWNKKLRDHFEHRHDNILFYSKSSNSKVQVFNGYSEKWASKAAYVKIRKQKIRTDKSGKEYVLSDSGNGGRIERSLDDAMEYGRPIDDVWNIDKLNNSDKEKVHWDTQKPLRLLERIILASTKNGDVVADFFCGCGTTISAAHKLGRHWIGVDASKEATTVIRKRMASEHGLEIDITPIKTLTKEEILSLEPYEFQKYVVRCIGGIPSDKRGGDGGVDGRLPDNTPIQVKKSDHIGRNVIDNFHKHIMKNGRGLIIAMSFGKGAKEEVNRLKLDEGVEVTLITVDQILRDAA